MITSDFFAKLLIPALFASVVSALPAFAEIPPALPVPAEGILITTPDWRASAGTQSQVPVSFGALEPSEEGLKLVTSQQPENIYNLQARVLNALSVHKADTIFLRFAARSLKADPYTGVTKITASFGKSSPDWDNSYKGEIGLTSEWQRYDIPFTCKNDFAEGEAQMTLGFGYAPQEVEVADVQVLRYGPEVSPASLPRTKRFADRIAPEMVQREIDRIARMKRELTATNDPVPANGTTLHVAKTGSMEGDGSAARPYATIPQALAVVKPGDTVEIGSGEYREPRGITIKTSGRRDAWIRLKAAAGARPKIVSSGWSGFEMKGGVCYVEIEGFELEWVPDPTIKAHGNGIAAMYACHHIRVLNNLVHGFGGGGIITLDCDYIHVEGNVVHKTAHLSPYGGSGISLCRAFDFDQEPGYHNVLRRNVSCDNENRVATLPTSGGNGRILTDGNGIIIDVFDRSRANPLKPHNEDREGPLAPYHGRTLIENNLVYDNGGRGIHVFRSSNVDVINNTCYMDQKTADVNAGELTAIQSSNVVIANNLAYGRQGKRGNTQDGSTRVIWSHNLIAHADDVLLHEGVLTDDPKFAAAALDAGTEGFRLQTDSPALAQGIAVIAPADDLVGYARPKRGPIDLGALQMNR